MVNLKDISPNSPHFHEQVTYDSKKENWSGVTSLFLIPVFILLVAWGVSSTFQLPVNSDTGGTVGGTARQNNLQIGVGGGPGTSTSATPSKMPSATVTPEKLQPTDSQEGLNTIQ